MKNDLSFSMSQSITEECSELVSSISEVTLDSVLEDGLLKDIPIIASAISVYKLGASSYQMEGPGPGKKE